MVPGVHNQYSTKLFMKAKAANLLILDWNQSLMNFFFNRNQLNKKTNQNHQNPKKVSPQDTTKKIRTKLWDKFWTTWKMTSLSAITVIRYLWVNHFFKIIESGILMKMDICLADFVTNTFQTTQNYASTLMQSINQWIAKIAIRLLSILPHCQGSHLPHAFSIVFWMENI